LDSISSRIAAPLFSPISTTMDAGVILKNRNAPRADFANSMRILAVRSHSACADIRAIRCDRTAITWKLHSPSDKVSAGRFRFLASTPKSCSLASEIRKELSGQLSTGQAGQLRNSAACRQTTASNREGSAEFAAKPFAATVAAYTQAGPSPVVEPLPSQVGTWLIEPLKAPAFPCRSCRQIRNFAHFTAASCCSTFGQQRRHSPSISCGY